MHNLAFIIIDIYIAYSIFPYLKDILALKWKNKIEVCESEILWKSEINFHKNAIFFFVIVKLFTLYVCAWIFVAALKFLDSNIYYENFIGIITLLLVSLCIFGGFIYPAINFKNIFLTQKGLISKTRFSGDTFYQYGDFVMYEDNHFRIPEDVIVIDSKNSKQVFVLPNSHNIRGDNLGDIVAFSNICKQYFKNALKNMDIESRANLFLKYHQSFAYGDIKRNLNYFTIDFSPYLTEIESYLKGRK